MTTHGNRNSTREPRSARDRLCCEVCGARVLELRRRRCTLCYLKWAEARPVGLGAQCIGCAERRRDFLKSAEVLGSFVPMCFSCAGRMSRLPRIPPTLASLRLALDRNRRRRERRVGKPDTRVYKIDRRSTDRRLAGRLAGDQFIDIDDDMIIEIQELSSDSSERAELTRIHRSMPAR
ncbi:MAG: hypothetical protein KJO07_17655 [Deltaproteobacteria bacterium]|jgi:hypothetical protein|nr:hypothetical protein [Deltaproteobacteria bacterium]